MPYGPITTQIFAKLIASPKYEEFRNMRPDEFCLSFSDRLFDFVSEYIELPSEPDKCRRAFTAIVNSGAAKYGFSFSRATLSEWISGGRDPSITGGEAQTRANIYKLCAALDFDLELSCELFEKVFFTRPFNPKNIKELCFLFFATQNSNDELFDGSWYSKAESFLSELNASAAYDTSPMLETRTILSDIGYLDTEEFRAYLIQNRRSFTQDNEYASAVEAVKQYAEKCCRTCKELDFSDSDTIPYDTLISSILGFSQRSVQGVSTPVSALKNLPQQLTANFPTGLILGRICAGQEKSYDKIYKMLCLLLFYYFFCMDVTPDKGSSDFKAFLLYANRQLTDVNLPELYPRQPFGAFILHCAASPDPLKEIGIVLNSKATEQSEDRLTSVLKASSPSASDELLKRCVRALGHAPWAVELTASIARKVGPGFSFSEFADEFEAEEYTDDMFSDILDYLFSSLGPTEQSRSIMRLASLIPAEGLKEELFYNFSDSRGTAEEIVSLGWLERKGDKLYIRSEVRDYINGQEWFPRWSSCRRYAECFAELCCAGNSIDGFSKELVAFGAKLSRLDGIPSEMKSKLLEIIRRR